MFIRLATGDELYSDPSPYGDRSLAYHKTARFKWDYLDLIQVFVDL